MAVLCQPQPSAGNHESRRRRYGEGSGAFLAHCAGVNDRLLIHVDLVPVQADIGSTDRYGHAFRPDDLDRGHNLVYRLTFRAQADQERPNLGRRGFPFGHFFHDLHHLSLGEILLLSNLCYGLLNHDLPSAAVSGVLKL